MKWSPDVEFNHREKWKEHLIHSLLCRNKKANTAGLTLAGQVFSFEHILKVNQYLQHSNSFIFQSTAILSLPCIIHPRKN